ncbi:MAG: type II secretion system protein GspJ, partial [Spirochaetota bacterium]
LFFLMHSEKNLYDTRNEDGAAEAVAPETESLMLENVLDMKCEFTADRTWDTKWSDTAPPKAVRTTLKMKNYRGTEETFVFTTILHRARQSQ